MLAAVKGNHFPMSLQKSKYKIRPLFHLLVLTTDASKHCIKYSFLIWSHLVVKWPSVHWTKKWLFKNWPWNLDYFRSLKNANYMHSWLNYFNKYSKRFMGDDWGFRCYFNKNDVISHNVLDEKDCIQSFIFDKHHICDKHGAPFA